MAGERNLATLIQSMTPERNKGEYVFVTVASLEGIKVDDALLQFREREGITLVLERSKADEYQLEYDFVTAWITLTVHSALDAVGLTAAFASALAHNNISCNVVAGYYHDHIFVAEVDAEKTLKTLKEMAS